MHTARYEPLRMCVPPGYHGHWRLAAHKDRIIWTIPYGP